MLGGGNLQTHWYVYKNHRDPTLAHERSKKCFCLTSWRGLFFFLSYFYLLNTQSPQNFNWTNHLVIKVLLVFLTSQVDLAVFSCLLISCLSISHLSPFFLVYWWKCLIGFLPGRKLDMFLIHEKGDSKQQMLQLSIMCVRTVRWESQPLPTVHREESS